MSSRKTIDREAPPPAASGRLDRNPPARVAPLGKAVAFALLAGIVCATRLSAPPHPAWCIAGLAVGATLWLRRDAWRALGAATLGFGLFAAHAAYGLAHQLPLALERQEVVLSGRVVELPRHDARRTWFRFRVDGDERQPPALRGRLLQLSWYDDGKRAASRRHEVDAGSRWRFRLRLRAPRGLRNPGVFDGERVALAQRVAAMGYVRDVQGARRLSPASGVDAWRERMSLRIARAVPSASSRYVRALALGDTRGLDDADWAALRATGLTHLIAISGFHVGMVASLAALFAGGVWRTWPGLGLRWPRPQAVATAALLAAAGYALLAGLALPTVRTVAMIAVVVLAWLLRRSMRVSDALALAALAMLLVDPLAVLTAGFWLSFAGVAWLAWCLPGVSGQAEGRWRLLGDFLSAQGVATLGLLPLTVVLFGQASLAGPFANLLAIPWWSLVVVPLSLSGTVLETCHAGWGGWAWRLAADCFDLSWPLFAKLAASPAALWWLPETRWFALPLALSGAIWCLLPRGVPGKPLASLLWLPLLWPDPGSPRVGGAELVVLDVGQGLSVVVRTAHHALLYDMGPAEPDVFDAGERVVLPSLRALGVRRLDAAVVSHGDNDHAGGFESVRRSMPPPVAFAPAGVGIDGTRPCVAGTAWEWDGVRFRFLHPPAHFPYLANESSCMLRIETLHGTALLTGDIGAVIERDLVRRDASALRADVALVAHHGSRESSDPGFIAATGARWALVSAGYGNRYRHPHPAAIGRWRHAGAHVAATLDGGALRVRLQDGGIAFETRRDAQPRLWDAVRRRARASPRRARQPMADARLS